MPRHPPCALNNLTNTQPKQLATKTSHHHPHQGESSAAGQIKDARVHCAVLNQQPATTPGGRTRPDPPTGGPALYDPRWPRHQESPRNPRGFPPGATKSAPSGPNSVPTDSPTTTHLRSTPTTPRTGNPRQYQQA